MRTRISYVRHRLTDPITVFVYLGSILHWAEWWPNHHAVDHHVHVVPDKLVAVCIWPDAFLGEDSAHYEWQLCVGLLQLSGSESIFLDRVCSLCIFSVLLIHFGANSWVSHWAATAVVIVIRRQISQRKYNNKFKLFGGVEGRYLFAQVSCFKFATAFLGVLCGGCIWLQWNSCFLP